MTATALTLPEVGDRHVPASAPFAGTDRLPDGTSPVGRMGTGQHAHPDGLLERAATCRARQPGTATIASTAEHWGRYAAWLVGRGITRLADVDAACYGEWAARVARLPVAGRAPAGWP